MLGRYVVAADLVNKKLETCGLSVTSVVDNLSDLQGYCSCCVSKNKDISPFFTTLNLDVFFHF